MEARPASAALSASRNRSVTDKKPPIASPWPEGKRGWVRHASRVLLFDQADRLLLFEVEDPNLDEPVLWLPPIAAGNYPERPLLIGL